MKPSNDREAITLIVDGLIDGGVKLVDALRKASASRIGRGGIGNGKNWYEQTPEERQYYRTIRAPWWARVTKNTLDVATYHLPELLYERQEEQGSDYSILFPNNVLAPLGVRDKDDRTALQRAEVSRPQLLLGVWIETRPAQRTFEPDLAIVRVEFDWSMDPEKKYDEALREIKALELLEVSLVASPMQPLARVHATETSG